MTLQVELTPELEAKLREQAAAARKDFAAFVLEILEETAALGPEEYRRPEELSPEEWAAEFQAWAASHRPLGHIVDDSRESIYRGCGE